MAEKDDYIRKVEALISRANHPQADENERESALAMADKIMAKHRLDRAMLFQSGEKPDREIIVKTYSGFRIEGFRYDAMTMRAAIFHHAGVMSRHVDAGWMVVGYEEDIYYAENLWTSVLLHFTNTMFPKWEVTRSFDSNVYRIKNAGYSWSQVRDMGIEKEAADQYGLLTEKNAGSKLRTAYKREAKRLGVEIPPGKQQPMKPERWRRSFSEAYMERLSARLWLLQERSTKEAGEAGAIALLTDEDRVKHKYWELFPDLHPDAQKARVIEREIEEKARLDKMTPAEIEREKAAKKRRTERYLKKYANSIDDRGREAGYEAANQVRLGREEDELVVSSERRALT